MIDLELRMFLTRIFFHSPKKYPAKICHDHFFFQLYMSLFSTPPNITCGGMIIIVLYALPVHRKLNKAHQPHLHAHYQNQCWPKRFEYNKEVNSDKFPGIIQKERSCKNTIRISTVEVDRRDLCCMNCLTTGSINFISDITGANLSKLISI